jgi:hypothetical protein
MNDGITSILLNTFNWRDLSRDLSLTFVILSLCKQSPTLAVSVCLGFKVMENQLALETGGFDWHT